MEPGQHVHLLENVQERGHGPARQVGLGRRPGFLAAGIELTDEEQGLHGREGNPKLPDRARGLLCMQMQHNAVSMALQRAVEVAPEDLPIQESNRDLSGRGLRGEVRIARKLDPLHGCERDPGRFVVLQAAGVINLDQEVGLVEVEVTNDPFEGLVIEEPHDYLGHLTSYFTNPHLTSLLRTLRRPTRRPHLTQIARCIRTASA